MRLKRGSYVKLHDKSMGMVIKMRGSRSAPGMEVLVVTTDRNLTICPLHGVKKIYDPVKDADTIEMIKSNLRYTSEEVENAETRDYEDEQQETKPEETQDE